VDKILRDLTEVAVRRDHDHYAVTLRACPSKRAAGADRFVIGVSVEADQSSHQVPFAAFRAGSAATTARLAIKVSILPSSKPQSRRISTECCPAWAGGITTSAGVREKRGAGAGCMLPAISTKVPRSTLCGCSA